MSRPGLRGMDLDPTADVGLPFLMILAVAAGVGALGAAFSTVLSPMVGALAFFVALESYLFTTVFFVREVDLPQQVRWVETAIMALLIFWVSGGDWEQAGTWFGSGLLAWAWWFGQRAARLAAPLHPVAARTQARLGQEGKKHNDHGEAYEAIRTQVLGMVAAVGLVAGIADWAQGRQGLWGWTGVSVWLLILAVAAAGALLAAARLRQQVTWAQEGLTPPDGVVAGWVPSALPLLLLSLLIALLLPAGPRVPVERWLLSREEDRRDLAPPAPVGPERSEPQGEPMQDMLRQLSGDAIAWPPWVGKLFYGLMIAAGVTLALWVLSRAARQLAERAGREELRGVWAWLSALASLWLALLGALGGAARAALAVPAAALEGALGEAGALGRLLPGAWRAPAEPRAAVRYFFARLQAEAARRRLGRAPGTTAREFGRQLGGALPEEAAQLEQLTRAYESARYGAEPVPEGEAGTARRAWLAIARALSRKR